MSVRQNVTALPMPNPHIVCLETVLNGKMALNLTTPCENKADDIVRSFLLQNR